jgi:hypothetical protein
MAVYLGYYRTTSSFTEENQARARSQGPIIDSKFRQMVVDLPDKLPAGCRIIGSYAPMGGGGAVLGDPGLPSVQIVDTGNPADLNFISQYYSGYLMFQWTPAISVGSNRQEREAALAATAAPAGVRA